MSEPLDAKQDRLQQAFKKTRQIWSRQNKTIFDTRADANFKRRHKTADRTQTLMDLQSQYKGIVMDSINTFYQSSLAEQSPTYKHFNNLTSSKIESLSSQER